MDNQIANLVKSTPNILSQIYGDLAKPSVKAIGVALGTVFEFSTSFLLPIKLLNEKFKMNFEKRLNEYGEKLEQIPEDKRCEVHPQIGTPIVEKLSYTTNEEIADLFTTLLANASNIDMVNTAHPAFINMIERITPDEAKLLKYLKRENDVLYCTVNGNALDGKGYRTLLEHITLIESEVKLDFPQNVNAYLANFVSLGILIDEKGVYKVDKTIYNKIKEVHKIKELEEGIVPLKYKSISVENSFFSLTPFGRLFIKACTK